MAIQNKILLILLLILIFWQPMSLIRGSFFEKGYWSRYENLKKLYENSQYVRKENPGIISDHILESFAGGAFLKGLNPILIVHDQPPLGRYLISLSILIFDNTRTIPTILLFISLIGIYLIAKLILKNIFLALIPVVLFTNEPLFLGKFTYVPLLEPIQLPFVIFAIYFFLRGVAGKYKPLKWWMLTGVMLGFTISIRYFVLGAALFSAFFAYFLLKKQLDKRLLVFILVQPIALIILLLSYFRTFQSGYNLIQVLGIQKYIFVYHQSAFVLPFSFWDLLMFNRWHTWWGTQAIATDPNWIFFWPLSVVIIVLGISLLILKKIKLEESELVILLWIFFYTAMLSVGYSSTRYFLPLLPFLYILALSFGVKIIKVVHKTTSGHLSRK